MSTVVPTVAGATGGLWAVWPRFGAPTNVFIGTRAECLARYPELARFDDGDDCPYLLADLHHFLGELIDPGSEAAIAMYVDATGAADCRPEAVAAWLIDDAQRDPEYFAQLAHTACQQGAITAAHLRLLLGGKRGAE